MNEGKYSAIVLAGGRSSRMGKPKSELRFGSRTMLDRILTEMARVFEEVIVATASARESERAKIIIDPEPYHGPVFAMERALGEVSFDRAFVCSCDVPFVNGDLALTLCGMLGDYDAVIPLVDGKLQTLHAVYRKECAKVLATMRGKDEHRLHEIVNFAKVKIIPEAEIRALDPDLTSFFNVNTPEDYQRALQLRNDEYKK